MSVNLNWTPIGLTVTLSPGVKFHPPGFQLQDGNGAAMDWPVGTTARLVLTETVSAFSTTWTAIITGAVLTFDESIANAAAVPDGAHAQLYLKYGSNDEILWQSGGVVRKS